MNVLLAQESRMVRSILRAGLGPTPYAAAPVHEAASVAELLRELEAVGLDDDTLLVLDWNLPGLDVPLLLSHISGKGIMDRISIVLCVNTGEAPLAERALSLGARGFLVRPFSNEDLAAKVNEIPVPRSAPIEAPGMLQDIVTTIRVQDELPSIFSLPSAVLSELFEGAARSRHEAGTVILFPGEHLSALPFVTSGEVEILGSERRDDRIVRGAGECFGERAFVCGEPARIRVQAITSVEIARVDKEVVVERARRHPELQDFLTLLLTRRPSPGTEDVEAELAGTIDSLPFSDLLQFLHSTRRSGVLVLESEGVTGRITLERGEVRDARVAGDEPGEAAFAHLAALPGVRFQFRAGSIPAPRTIVRSTMQLLMGCFLPSAQVG